MGRLDFDDGLEITRRHFFGRAGLGAVALASLLEGSRSFAAPKAAARSGGLPGLPHFEPRASA